MKLKGDPYEEHALWKIHKHPLIACRRLVYFDPKFWANFDSFHFYNSQVFSSDHDSSMSVFSVYILAHLSQGWMANFPAFIAPNFLTYETIIYLKLNVIIWGTFLSIKKNIG